MRGLGVKTIEVVEAARAVMEENQPSRMTLRQVFYQLVSRQIIDNNQSSYERLGRYLVTGRKTGRIPWEWIEDRTRQSRNVSMWTGLPEYMETVKASYRRDVWKDQPRRIEVWLEKDTLSGLFAEALEPFRVPLNVSRGFDGWSSIYEATSRLDDSAVILHFSDFDPSGEDMVRSLRERLGFFGVWPEIKKIALTLEEVEKYKLPPNKCKSTDGRSRRHIEQYGNVSVELDALPPAVLGKLIHDAVRGAMDVAALTRTLKVEERERKRLRAQLGRITR